MTMPTVLASASPRTLSAQLIMLMAECDDRATQLHFPDGNGQSCPSPARLGGAAATSASRRSARGTSVPNRAVARASPASAGNRR